MNHTVLFLKNCLCVEFLYTKLILSYVSTGRKLNPNLIFKGFTFRWSPSRSQIVRWGSVTQIINSHWSNVRWLTSELEILPCWQLSLLETSSNDKLLSWPSSQMKGINGFPDQDRSSFLWECSCFPNKKLIENIITKLINSYPGICWV